MNGLSPRSLLQIAAVLGLAAAGALAALLVGPVVGPVAAVFPPWWDAGRVLKAAAEGGPVMRFGDTRFVVLVVPDGPAGRDRLWQAGAWLLLNPLGLTGCSSLTELKIHVDSDTKPG